LTRVLKASIAPALVSVATVKKVES
jgi:hypothetical protein